MWERRPAKDNALISSLLLDDELADRFQCRRQFVGLVFDLFIPYSRCILSLEMHLCLFSFDSFFFGADGSEVAKGFRP